MKKNLSYPLVLAGWIGVLLLSIGCSSGGNYFPPQHASLDSVRYATFRDSLGSAYERADHFSIALQLANLVAPPELIYAELGTSIQQDPARCESLFRMRYVAEQGFFYNLYKADTLRFAAIFGDCLEQFGPDAYALYRQRQWQEETTYAASRPPLDSSQLRSDWMETLRQIDADDQRYRLRIVDFRISTAERDSLRGEQDRLDSLNLQRVDRFLREHGYPSPSQVGYELKDAIFLVLHHQRDTRIRDRYFRVVSDYLPEGQRQLFTRRTASLRERGY